MLRRTLGQRFQEKTWRRSRVQPVDSSRPHRTSKPKCGRFVVSSGLGFPPVQPPAMLDRKPQLRLWACRPPMLGNPVARDPAMHELAVSVALDDREEQMEEPICSNGQPRIFGEVAYPVLSRINCPPE